MLRPCPLLRILARSPSDQRIGEGQDGKRQVQVFAGTRATSDVSLAMTGIGGKKAISKYMKLANPGMFH